MKCLFGSNPFSVFPNLKFLLNLFSKNSSLFPLIRSVDKWISSAGYPQRGKHGRNQGLIHALSTSIVENNHLMFSELFQFSTLTPAFHIFIIPAKMGVWEGLLAWGSYPRLSPLILACVRLEITKKTCTPFIHVRWWIVPGVIPEITHRAKSVWKRRWKKGVLPPKKAVSDWN
ncbi:MAG: hypothetical protein JWR44_2327 [Hymenobacter sp.]|nr:hypothetical protein [Hymenobacter sp.]